MISHKFIRALQQNTRPFFSVFKNKHDLGECRNLITELGQVSDERPVPDHIPKPNYYFTPMNKPARTLGPAERKNIEQINGMRETCRLAANILHSVPSILRPGITTDDIDAFVHDKVVNAGAYPSTLRYLGFPKSICTSVNNCACHGIPDDRKLCDGDIINVDITVFFKGFHGDCSKTFFIGKVDDRGKYLVESTEECLNAAIDICKPNTPINAIGNVIQELAHKKNLNVYPHFTGHGIGSYFHGPPEIIHVKNNYGGFMQPGMTFTIEPILTLGDTECELWEDGWTIISVDGARSAQFEHTILITDNGHEVLTLPDSQ